MVAEKVAAAYEGGLAASGEAQNLVWRAWTGVGPVALAAGLFSVAHAATAPAHRRVHANAKRLSRSRR